MSIWRRAVSFVLVVMAAACGGPSVVVDHDGEPIVAVETESIATARGRMLLAEAWPEPVDGHVDRLYDGRVDASDFVLGASTSLPVTLVFRVVDGPLEIAAVSLGTVDDPRSVRDVAVFTYLGDVPVDRDTFHRFVQNATPAGVARLEPGGGETVLRFAAPILAHYVFVRVDAVHGGEGVILAEVAAYEADELLDLAESTQAVRWVELTTEALEPIERDAVVPDAPDTDGVSTDLVDVFESVETGTGEDEP